MIEVKGKYTDAHIMIDDVDPTTMSQVVEMINNEVFTNPVRIMPDCHAGKGSVIGFTMEIGDKIIPNTVSVDIGCGMLSGNLGKNLFANVRKEDLDREMRKRVPVGTNIRDSISPEFDDKLFYSRINRQIYNLRVKFGMKFNVVAPVVRVDDEYMEDLCKMVKCDFNKVLRSIGSLGGGNHFIEIGKSEATGDYWLTIHSGSRNFGKCIAEYHQRHAVIRCQTPTVSKSDFILRVKKDFDQKNWQEEIARYSETQTKYVPKGMEYLQGDDMYEYLVHMIIAQTYADFNRKVMMDELAHVLDDLGVDYQEFREEIVSVHNFIDFEDWIIRKGAIRSYVGEKMIIPWNMEDGLTICEGKSNPEWNYSAPHGAGRLFSRSEAKRKLNLDDAKESMKAKGIYSSGIPHDEIKGAYKDPEIIEICIEPTATIIDRIKPVMNMKG